MINIHTAQTLGLIELHGKVSRDFALDAAQVQATLALAQEIRWLREMLEERTS